MHTYILIPVFNNSAVTIECLRSLDHRSAIPFTVIIGDNGSVDAEFAKLSAFIMAGGLSFPVSLIRSEHNVGFGAINNRMCASIPEQDCYLLLLNNDTTVSGNLLDVLHKEFNASPATGGVCPVIVYDDCPDRIWYGGGRISLRKKSVFVQRYMDMPLAALPTQSWETEFLTGCALFTTKRIFCAAGAFDENYFLYFEDVDLSFGIKRQGLKLWVTPLSVVRHKGSVSVRSRESSFARYHLTRSRYYFCKKWFNPAALFVMLCKALREMAGYAFKMFKRDEWPLVKAGLKGFVDGIALTPRKSSPLSCTSLKNRT